MKQEKVLEGEIPRLESTQLATGEEQKTRTNSTVTNDPTKIKLKGRIVGDMHRSGSKSPVLFMSHVPYNWNIGHEKYESR